MGNVERLAKLHLTLMSETQATLLASPRAMEQPDLVTRPSGLIA
jgi:hypothetical protein